MVKKDKSPKSPKKTQQDFAMFRFTTACKTGKKALDNPNTCPPETNPTEWALFNLFCALEELPLILKEPKEP